MNGRTEGEQLSTSITKDVGINALRDARVTMEESMALASECIIAYRSTVKEQATRITELESKLAAAEHRIASQKVEVLELEELNDSMHQRLTAHAEDRIRPRSHSDADIEQANADKEHAWQRNRMPSPWDKSRMSEVFADLIVGARKAGKQDWIDKERARTNRIATGIINRLDDDHPVLAYHLALTLQEETRDGDDNKKDAGNSSGARPRTVEPGGGTVEHIREAVREFDGLGHGSDCDCWTCCPN